jgi:hypothetical protein
VKDTGKKSSDQDIVNPG